MYKKFLLISSSLLVVACAVVPVKKPHSQRDVACGLSTHEWDLKMVQAGSYSANCNSPECVVSVGLVAAAATGITAIVSGSIVLVGNMIHWVEQQGDCDIDKLDNVVNEINKPLLDQGGKPIKTIDELEHEYKELQ